MRSLETTRPDTSSPLHRDIDVVDIRSARDADAITRQDQPVFVWKDVFDTYTSTPGCWQDPSGSHQPGQRECESGTRGGQIVLYVPSSELPNILAGKESWFQWYVYPTIYSAISEKPYSSVAIPKDRTPRSRDEITDLVRRIIQETDYLEIDCIEQELWMDPLVALTHLRDAALDTSELINVRAMAARLFVSKAGQHPPVFYGVHSTLENLKNNESPLVRLGSMLGYSDAKNLGAVKEFLKDPHQTVSSEAKEQLEELED